MDRLSTYTSHVCEKRGSRRIANILRARKKFGGGKFPPCRSPTPRKGLLSSTDGKLIHVRCIF